MSRVEMMALNNSGFAFDPMSGESYTLNETGVDVIRALQVGKTEREIAEQLSNEYEVEALDTLTDVLDFIKQLKMFRLIE